MIHTYELGLLQGDDLEEFELHLVFCEHCFASVKRMERHVGNMRTNPDVVERIHELSAAADEPSGALEKIRARWQSIPAFLRPAISLVVLLFVLYPVYEYVAPVGTDSGAKVNSTQTAPPSAGPQQEIRLYANRSVDNDAHLLEPDENVTISFFFDNSNPQGKYHVILYNGALETVYDNETFSGFNSESIGRITIDSGKLPAGKYKLTITDPAEDPATNTQEYRFTVRYR